nr:hypothetical protein [Alphaproteobacteria bacterium]
MALFADTPVVELLDTVGDHVGGLGEEFLDRVFGVVIELLVEPICCGLFGGGKGQQDGERGRGVVVPALGDLDPAIRAERHGLGESEQLEQANRLSGLVHIVERCVAATAAHQRAAGDVVELHDGVDGGAYMVFVGEDRFGIFTPTPDPLQPFAGQDQIRANVDAGEIAIELAEQHGI